MSLTSGVVDVANDSCSSAANINLKRILPFCVDEKRCCDKKKSLKTIRKSKIYLISHKATQFFEFLTQVLIGSDSLCENTRLASEQTWILVQLFLACHAHVDRNERLAVLQHILVAIELLPTDGINT